MNDADKPQFLKVLNGMASMKKQPLTPEVLDLWWACMSGWTIEDFKAAAIHVLKSTTFMPTPKDFEDLRKAGRPTADEAWELAYQHVKSGAYRHGPLGNPLIDHVVHMINGYTYIAFYDVDNLHFLKRDFREAYEKTEDVEDIRHALPSLTLTEVLKLRRDDPQLE